jgi:hypothetical protein
MACPRCGADTPSWCKHCESAYDTWSRRHAADILWQAGTGALVAMVFGLGGPLLGLSPIIGIAGVLMGAATAYGLRKSTNARRRQQYIETSVPRAQLMPGKT